MPVTPPAHIPHLADRGFPLNAGCDHLELSLLNPNVQICCLQCAHYIPDLYVPCRAPAV